MFSHYGNPNFDLSTAVYDLEYQYQYLSPIENITDFELMYYVDQGYFRLTISYDSFYRTDINEQASVSKDDVYNYFCEQIGIYLDASMLTIAEFPVFLINYNNRYFHKFEKFVESVSIEKNLKSRLLFNQFILFIYKKNSR